MGCCVAKAEEKGNLNCTTAVTSPLQVHLKVIESVTFDPNTTFIITSKGLINNESKDPNVYISKEGVLQADQGPTMMHPQYTRISYNAMKKIYEIQGMTEGPGSFMKITHPLVLQQEQIISFGDSHMAINLEK